MRLKAIVLLFLMTGSMVHAAHSGNDRSYRDAVQAFYSDDIPKTVDVLNSVLLSEACAEEKAKACSLLGLIEMHHYKNFEAARERLVQGLKHGVDRVSLYKNLARLESQCGNDDAAREAALQGLMFAGSNSEIREAKMLFTGIIIERAKRSRFDASAARLTDPDRALLREAKDILAPMVSDDIAAVDCSLLALHAALLLDDGHMALAAWRAYYQVPPGTDGWGVLKKPALDLERLLSGWKGKKATLEDRESLVRCLARSMMFEEAALAALDPEFPEIRERVSDIVSYAFFLREVRGISDEYYRKTALGQGNPLEYQLSLLKLTARYWDRLGLSGRPPECLEKNSGKALLEKDLFPIKRSVFTEVRRHHNVEINLNRTEGVLDLHMGHCVSDEKLVIEQYGLAATVKHVQLDGIVSNGYRSWVEDNFWKHGGWTSASGKIYSIRPTYLFLIIPKLQRYLDPKIRLQRERDLELGTPEEDGKLDKDPVAYCPGVMERLMLTSFDRLYERFWDEGYRGATLDNRFVGKAFRLIFDEGMTLHEGRHALDVKYLGFTGADQKESEFNARLSQVAFSEIPGYQLYNATKGYNPENTRRILTGIWKWSINHDDEVQCLDKSRPFMSQLHLLTDEQLRAAVRSMDPMAK